MWSDPIADMLTRIRNAGQARLATVSMPSSRMKEGIARVLRQRGFIAGYRVEGDPKKPVLVIELRYGRDHRPLIEGIERVSKPGRRIYVGVREIPRVRSGLGVAILSTPKGILSDDEARAEHVGGELLARVW